MTITPITSVTEALPLLRACGLPVCDLSGADGTSASLALFGIRADGELVGVVGLEAYGACGLLRSLAVAPAQRGSGMARRLVEFVEAQAVERGIHELFLLTSTAEAFFMVRGYAPVSRTAAPPAIQGTAQFSGVCPSSAAFLGKRLSPT